MPTTSREFRLKSRPVGTPTADNFELATRELPDPAEGELLIKNLYMSVDPYMRGRMNDRKSYVPPFQIGEPLAGGAVGEVVASNHAGFEAGEYVYNFFGWQEYAISNGQGLMKVDPAIPLSAYLGTAGMPGQTAYFGLLDIGQPKDGETVFVSAAAGAVGSVVCQIAKLKGCTVIGTAGSDEKVAWLQEKLGVDVAINYKTAGHLTKALAEAAPQGIDIYFENVGGEHLEAAIAVMNPHGRIAVCGMISQYNATEPQPGPRNLSLIIGKQILMKGFLVGSYRARTAEFMGDLTQWIQSGQLTWEETVYDGFETMPQAFVDLFAGGNLGKMVVKV